MDEIFKRVLSSKQELNFATEILKRAATSSGAGTFDIRGRENLRDLYMLNTLKNIRNYWTGEFIETTKNEGFNKISNKFFAHLWEQDIKVFYNDLNDEFKLYSKKLTEQLETDNTVKVVDLLQNKVINVDINYYNQMELVSWNSAGNNNFLTTWIFAAENEDLKANFLTSTIWDSKQEIIDFKGDKDITIEQWKQHLTPYFPAILTKSILNIDKNNNVPDTIDAIQKELKASELFNSLINHYNYFKDQTGMAASMELKKERKSMSEGEIDKHNTSNIQNITLRELQAFSHNMKKTFNVELKFSLNFQEENNEENEEIEKENKEVKNDK